MDGLLTFINDHNFAKIRETLPVRKIQFKFFGHLVPLLAQFLDTYEHFF